MASQDASEPARSSQPPEHDRRSARPANRRGRPAAIAGALVNNLPLALADEPTGALDSQTTGDIRRRCEQPHAEEGLAIILMTHDARRKRRR